jgi:hypothetical protein
MVAHSFSSLVPAMAMIVRIDTQLNSTR